MNWNLDWERDNKYKRMRLAKALSPSCIPLSYNELVLTTRKKNPCEYMLNAVKCIKKRLSISYGLTKDSFLELMTSSYFKVEDYQIELKKAGDLDSGWCFMIRGYYLTP
jgi:hypothetical protein